MKAAVVSNGKDLPDDGKGNNDGGVGRYKLPLGQYTYIGRVLACSFQQKYDFSQVLLRPADVLPTPAPLVILVPGVLSGAYSHRSSKCRGSTVAQRYVGSISSNVHQLRDLYLSGVRT